MNSWERVVYFNWAIASSLVRTADNTGSPRVIIGASWKVIECHRFIDPFHLQHSIYISLYNIFIYITCITWVVCSFIAQNLCALDFGGDFRALIKAKRALENKTAQFCEHGLLLKHTRTCAGARASSSTSGSPIWIRIPSSTLRLTVLELTLRHILLTCPTTDT